MKRILVILCASLCLSSCTSVLIAVADMVIPDPSISVNIDGMKYNDSEESGTFRIYIVEGEGFAIAYTSQGWENENALEEATVNLNCGFFDAEFKKGVEYVFTEDDKLDTYPYFYYKERDYRELTPDSSVYSYISYWFNATSGWFKITKLNEKDGTISGRFAFTAVSDDPDCGDVIEITDGVFKNIPYTLVEDQR